MEKLVLKTEEEIASIESQIEEMDNLLSSTETINDSSVFSKYDKLKDLLDKTMENWETYHVELEEWETKKIYPDFILVPMTPHTHKVRRRTNINQGSLTPGSHSPAAKNNTSPYSPNFIIQMDQTVYLKTTYIRLDFQPTISFVHQHFQNQLLGE